MHVGLGDTRACLIGTHYSQSWSALLSTHKDRWHTRTQGKLGNHLVVSHTRLTGKIMCVRGCVVRTDESARARICIFERVDVDLGCRWCFERKAGACLSVHHDIRLWYKRDTRGLINHAYKRWDSRDVSSLLLRLLFTHALKIKLNKMLLPAPSWTRISCIRRLIYN